MRGKGGVYKAIQRLKNIAFDITESKRGVVSYSKDDDLPNKVIRAVNASGTASSCQDKLNTFIQAKGFVDEQANNIQVNKTQTGEDLLDDLAMYASYFPAVALRVYFNNFGEVTYLKSVPIPHVRPYKDRFILNPKFGEKGFNRRDNIELEAFDPNSPAVDRQRSIARQKAQYGYQVGQLLWHISKSAVHNGDLLPIPDYIGGYEDIESDAALSILERNNIKKGWRGQIIIGTGEIDDTNKDDDGLTDKDYFNETLRKFTGEDGSQVLHIESTDGVEPSVNVIKLSEVLDASEKATHRLAMKVARIMKVPPVLIGLSTAGKLGDMQELENHLQLFSMHVGKRQRLISRALEMATKDSPKFKGVDWQITSLNLFKYVPKELLAKLSKEEIAELYDIKLPEQENGNGNQNSEVA